MGNRIQIIQIKSEETWELRRSVMWPEKDIGYVKLPEDPAGIHWGLFENQNLISIVSLFITYNSAQFRKLATVKEKQGQGYGTALLNHMLTEIDAIQIKKIWCNARIDKANFYKRFGLTETNKRFIIDETKYVVMERLI